MELDDGELEVIARSLGINVDALARKLRRVPPTMRTSTASDLDESETLLRRIRDEQRDRRKAIA